MFPIHEYLPDFQKIRRVVTTNPGVTVALCTPNPDRAILVIGVSIGSAYYVSVDPNFQPTAAELSGTGPDTIILDWTHYGPMPTEGYFGQIGGASGTVSFVVIEYVWNPPPDLP